MNLRIIRKGIRVCKQYYTPPGRLIIQGTVARDFDYYIQPEFGYPNTYSSITATAPSAYGVALQDAWIDWKYFP